MLEVGSRYDKKLERTRLFYEPEITGQIEQRSKKSAILSYFAEAS